AIVYKFEKAMLETESVAIWDGLADLLMRMRGGELEKIMDFISRKWKAKGRSICVQSISNYGDQLIQVARCISNTEEEDGWRWWLIEELSAVAAIKLNVCTGRQPWNGVTSFVLESISSDSPLLKKIALEMASMVDYELPFLKTDN
ncbi:hypothetical protein PMAYCL1PPCAC_02106, partial [Pristionchus mayeri]